MASEPVFECLCSAFVVFLAVNKDYRLEHVVSRLAIVPAANCSAVACKQRWNKTRGFDTHGCV